MKKLFYCCLVAIATVSCASKQVQETVIHLKTNRTEAVRVNLDPLSYWDIYHSSCLLAITGDSGFHGNGERKSGSLS